MQARCVHDAVWRRLPESVDAPDVVQGPQLGREAAVYAEKLPVHERSQGQAVKRLHAHLIHLLGVLHLACAQPDSAANQPRASVE